MNPETKIMSHRPPAKHENSVTMPYRKTRVNDGIRYILHLPGGQQIICYSCDGTFRVWDLETGTQVKEWEDIKYQVFSTALSPGSKTVATGHGDGVVKLWDVDTGKVIKTLTGHAVTKRVHAVCWSPDGERVAGGFEGAVLRVWDVKSGETVLGPINAASGDPNGADMYEVGYSPDGKMIATAVFTSWLKIWDANTGEFLKLLVVFSRIATCLAWTSDGKTLFSGGWRNITKFNLATRWSRIAVIDVNWEVKNFTGCVGTISLSPNQRILAGTPFLGRTVQLWNVETNQPIGPLLRPEGDGAVFQSTTFSADGKFLVTSCEDYLYTWDLSAIVKEAGLPLDILDTTPRPAPKSKDVPRIPRGFFDDDLRRANSRIRLSQSHRPYHLTPAPRQRTLDRFYSFWHRPKSQSKSDYHTRPRSHLLSRTRNLVSGILGRRDSSDFEVQEVEVPCTAGKETIMLERSQLAARLDLPKSKSLKDLARHHNCHLQLPLPRHFLLSMIPPEHREYPHVLISPVVDGAFVFEATF
ncbi:WD40-repeat-containing domain protein [Suillus bovinus]|uniref:WD40-repeat-containing domain protein n=1 Tax=Suillus bovinus TaxID=48563 RepID=UPI001B877005|nr:WD40-repeat-containing domain protein [Suillus bovinus]KAG2133816.1 WD40-repeat-containing domain protein [Suillus bovinus]